MRITGSKLFLAEFLGTFFLLFISLGAIMLSLDPGTLFSGQGSAVQMSAFSPLSQALIFGLVLMAVSYTMGHISGAHCNPAVSLGLMLAGHLRVVYFPVYLVAQCCGAMVAVLAVRFLFQGNETFVMAELSGIGNTFDQGGQTHGFTPEACALVEGVGVCLLTYLYIATQKAHFPKNLGGLAKGLGLAAALLLAVPLTNGGLNPARSAAAALLVGGDAFKQLWFFVTVPIIGAVVGVIFDHMMWVDDAGSRAMR